MVQRRSEAVEWLRAEVARALAPLSAGLVEVLGRLISHRYPEQLAFVEFQVFPDPSAFTGGFPVRALFLDKDNTEHFEQVNGEAAYPISVDPGLLKVPCVVPRQTWEAWEQHDPQMDSWTMAAEAVVPRFSECWKRAGGADFSLPAFVCLHDDEWTYDLREGWWCEADTGKPIPSRWPPRSA